MATSIEGAIAVTRFGLGARRNEIETASEDPSGWLTGQLSWSSAAGFPDDALQSSRDGVLALIDYFQRRRLTRSAEAQAPDPERVAAFARDVRRNMIKEVQARATFGALTPAGFHERLTRFWSNHFTVSARGLQTAMVAGAYEREAIRPKILGRFVDLLFAAVKHPAMLIYLDNWQSVGPQSRAGRRRGRGLNENLAREVLELHTVTPAAGYTQDDVTEFAKALTGWTVGNNLIGQDRKGETTFEPIIHEPGARRILGKRYPDAGSAQADLILEDLAAHPATAQNVAFKLARHIVADDPPPALVDRLAQNFLETGGDLDRLYRELIKSPEAWAEPAGKVKTPDEVLTSTARLLGLDRVFAGEPRDVLESFAQRPFAAPSPEGWPDTGDAWLGPDAIVKRIEWANRLGERSPEIDAREFLETALGPLASHEAKLAVSRAESGAQAIAIALMSPDFQRR